MDSFFTTKMALPNNILNALAAPLRFDEQEAFLNSLIYSDVVHSMRQNNDCDSPCVRSDDIFPDWCDLAMEDFGYDMFSPQRLDSVPVDVTAAPSPTGSDTSTYDASSQESLAYAESTVFHNRERIVTRVRFPSPTGSISSDTTSGHSSSPSSRRLQSSSLKKRSRSRTKKQPVPEDFATHDEFLAEWRHWRALRDSNNISVKRSRVNKKHQGLKGSR